MNIIPEILAKSAVSAKIFAQTKPAIDLSYFDIAIAAGLILITGAVSVFLRLKMEKRLIIASIRTVAQLALVGLLLEKVFKMQAWWGIILLMILMIFAASRSSVGRLSRRFAGVNIISFASLTAVGFFITFSVTQGVIRVDPWYSPQYVIPILGMVLGNCLTAISLCLDNLLEELSDKRDEIEMRLSLGATSWEAAIISVQNSVRKGLIPITNSMMVVGIVSVPGMMTGQIIAGASPISAVKYQIMIMFMIAAATALGCISVVLLSARKLFTQNHQLDYLKITKKKP